MGEKKIYPLKGEDFLWFVLDSEKIAFTIRSKKGLPSLYLNISKYLKLSIAE